MIVNINDWIEATISLPSKKFTEETGNTNIFTFVGKVKEVTEKYLILTNGQVVAIRSPYVEIKILKNVVNFPQSLTF